MSFSCSRRMFLLGSATTVAGAFLAACGEEPSVEVSESDVPVGSALLVDGLIIAQPTEGNFVAYSQKCPHQGNLITKVEGDQVRCTVHNSVFDIRDGAVVEGPSRDPLEPAEVSESNGSISATTS